jgi:hypothetical protein
MVEISGALAVSFVEPRGTTAAVVGDTVGGAAGGAISHAGEKGFSPLEKGQIGFLAVMPDRLVLFQAKRGAFKPKVTDTVLAQMASGGVVSASLERKRLSGVLDLTFTDGSVWSFEIPGANLGDAQKVADIISPRQPG